MMQVHKSKRGFTLVEMMLALAIITIIGWTTVALMMAVKNSFMTTYNTNDSADYAMMYANGFENAYLAHTQNNTNGKFYIDPTHSVLMQTDAKEVFKARQMKTTNLTTGNTVDKWNVRIFFRVSATDASQIVKYKVYVLDNYYSPNKVMSVYEGSVWAPHMGMERITVSNINGDDDINKSIRTSMGADSANWYDCIEYTQY